MKIAIVGPGALGCLIAGYLKAKTKEDIVILDEFAGRARKINSEGVRVESTTGTFTARVHTTADPKEVGPCDVAIICVKSYSTESACVSIKDIVSEKTCILTLQNGIGNVQILNDHFGPERIVAGATNHGATLISDGRVRHAGSGDTIIGRVDGRVLGTVRDLASILTKAGFEAKVSKDIDSVIWSKLIVNAGINAITAISGLKNGELIELDECRQILRSSVQESVRIVKRKRIKLLYDDPIQKVESVCRATADNASSMLQDVLNKRRTEIDFINGAIVRQAKALNIPTPVNEVLTNLVKTIEKSYNNSSK